MTLASMLHLTDFQDNTVLINPMYILYIKPTQGNCIQIGTVNNQVFLVKNSISELLGNKNDSAKETEFEIGDNQWIANFATNNDTNKWLVSVDGYFQLFDTKQECMDFSKKLIDPNIDIAETIFESHEILPPHTISDQEQYPISEYSKVSEHNELPIPKGAGFH